MSERPEGIAGAAGSADGPAPGPEVLARLRPRALHRAEEGRTLTRDEIASLLTCRDEDLDRLLAIASGVRDRAPWYAEGSTDRPAGWGRTPDGGRRITYSRKVFVPLTHLCRDTCGYCTFAWPPKADVPAFLSPDQVVDIARRGQDAGCTEVLFTLGDQPELRYPAARDWLEARGYDTTLEYLRAVAIQVIEATGLLPHLNPGVMSWTELATLKPVAASMGIMLESTSRRLLEKGGAHWNSPDKDPEVRLRTLEDAGRLSVPFTSGLLLGIGETLPERADTLLALRATHRRYGHLQEVIVQNFRAKPDTAMKDHPEPSFEDLLASVATARIVLGPTVHVQAPPNLSPGTYGDILRAGIDDWGGVSPPVRGTSARGHARPRQPRSAVAPPRRPGPPHRRPRVRADARACPSTPSGPANPTRGSRDGCAPRSRPWPVRMGSRVRTCARRGSRGRTRRWRRRPSPRRWLRSSPVTRRGDRPRTGATPARPRPRTTCTGPSTATCTRSPTVCWPPTPRGSRARPAATIRPDVAAALARAQRGSVLDDRDALLLLETTGVELEALATAADEVRADRVGDTVTYVVNRNLNFTNICYTGCRFCAFAQRRDDPDAYNLSLTEIGDRVADAVDLGATEVCLQGGIHPDLPGDYYFDVIDAVLARAPDVHVHAFSPMEVVNGATRLGIPVREWLEEAKRRGLGSLPGTAAEILDDEVRWVLTKGKLPADQWVEVVTTAHELGIPTTSTMMYGHVDEPRHWVAHIKLLRVDPGAHRRLHRVRPAAVRAPAGADLPRRGGPPGRLVRGFAPRPRAGPPAAAGRHRPRAALVGQARARSGRHPPGRRVRRPRWDADGGDHLAHGRR